MGVAKVDSTHGNAYTAWIALGKPEAPTGTMDAALSAKLHASSQVEYAPVAACGPCSSS